MSLDRFLLLLTSFVLILVSCSHQSIKSEASSIRQSLVEQLQTVLSTNMDSLFNKLPVSGETIQLASEAYKSSDYKPFWITNSGISAASKELILAIKESEMNGLDPNSYHVKSISDLLNQIGKTNLALLDVTLTAAFFDLTKDITSGKIKPTSVDQEWFVLDKRELGQTFHDIRSVATTEGLRNSIDSLYPSTSDYSRLRSALKSLREFRKIGEWPSLPVDINLRPGDRDINNVPLLRSRLLLSRDLLKSDPKIETDLFAPDIESGLRNFQLRHGLDPNGVLNSETIRELNVPIESRIHQIEVNMERWRWLPQNLSKTYVMVNVADYSLSIIDDQHVLSFMSVVVGKDFRRTPSFLSEIVAIEINPKWVVPQKLAKEDLLPVLRSDPETLKKKGFRFYSRKNGEEVDPKHIDWQHLNDDLFPYRVIQDSGPLNALGKMKFWLPNQFGIFLHDTPSRELFEKKVRTFSSGCVRIEKPFELAEYLLRDSPHWNRLNFQREVLSGVNRTIGIKPLPVYLLYWTAWVDEKGILQFRSDVYGRNWQLNKLLHPVVK